MSRATNFTLRLTQRAMGLAGRCRVVGLQLQLHSANGTHFPWQINRNNMTLRSFDSVEMAEKFVDGYETMWKLHHG